ncbi:MPT63 family protein [Mycolicibacterium chlorophenolicum]|uniref:Immunogenic protein MPT63 n=1 Tax=Mycolicibacterium chlorophenolicum TaxID=37916 RepID=A0A0J6VA25_9MYCO|nr:MPT63 family protein [Mycolicibacterium chlorophenolicum]KMO67024.1 Immunogenic protein MPT63 precursor [Mycolicibacterium chlorophenolicum]
MTNPPRWFLSGATAAALASGLIATGTATNAYADDLETTTLGGSAQLINGDVVQRWTVSALQPSSDAIPYPVTGTLWEAKASDAALQGNAIPIVSNFNARTRDGHDYRVLFTAATPQGVNPATLTQGQTTTGKLYFDVTGPPPDSVVFNAAGHDLAVWRPAPPPPPTSSGTGSVPSASTTPQTALPAANSSTPTAAPAAIGATPPPAPEAGSAGTPLPAPGATSPAPAATAPPAPAAGSAGTPLPAGSAGTPVVTPPAAADSAGTPATPTAPVAPPTTTAAGPPSP